MKKIISIVVLSLAVILSTGVAHAVDPEMQPLVIDNGSDITECSPLLGDCPTSVPEPSAFILLLAGVASFALIRRKRK